VCVCAWVCVDREREIILPQLTMWSRVRGDQLPVNVLLAAFLVVEGVQSPVEESPELIAWLDEQLAKLTAEDLLRLPAEVSAWPHTRWTISSASTIRCLRDALTALSETLIKPLVQELSNSPKESLTALHKYMARFLGKVVKDLLPVLVENRKMEFTLKSPVPNPDGSISVGVPPTIEAMMRTTKAKKEAAEVAREVLGLLGVEGKAQTANIDDRRPAPSPTSSTVSLYDEDGEDEDEREDASKSTGDAHRKRKHLASNGKHLACKRKHLGSEAARNSTGGKAPRKQLGSARLPASPTSTSSSSSSGSSAPLSRLRKYHVYNTEKGKYEVQYHDTFPGTSSSSGSSAPPDAPNEIEQKQEEED
jgi:hypothetical protein